MITVLVFIMIGFHKYASPLSYTLIKISIISTGIYSKIDIYGYSSLAVCGWCVCLWSQWINTSGGSLDTCHNHQSFIPPGANCSLLFCSVLYSFSCCESFGITCVVFCIALLETYQRFSINQNCMACFLFFAFCHLFFSQNMFLIYVSMYFCCFCALIN